MAGFRSAWLRPALTGTAECGFYLFFEARRTWRAAPQLEATSCFPLAPRLYRSSIHCWTPACGSHRPGTFRSSADSPFIIAPLLRVQATIFGWWPGSYAGGFLAPCNWGIRGIWRRSHGKASGRSIHWRGRAARPACYQFF